MRYHLFVICLVGMGLASRAWSDPTPPPLGDYLAAEIGSLNETLQQNDIEPLHATSPDKWFFRRFDLRLRVNVTFTAGIAKLGIVPELELLWEAELPPGWEPFKPKGETVRTVAE